MNTGIYEHLFEYYPFNEHIELDVFQMALIARETLPYTKLLDEKDVFGEDFKQNKGGDNNEGFHR